MTTTSTRPTSAAASPSAAVPFTVADIGKKLDRRPPTMEHATLARRLKEIREAAHLTQARTANLLNQSTESEAYNVITVARIEGDKRRATAADLIAYADAFGLTLDQVVNATHDPADTDLARQSAAVELRHLRHELAYLDAQRDAVARRIDTLNSLWITPPVCDTHDTYNRPNTHTRM